MDAMLYCSLLVWTGLLACFPNQEMDIWWHLKTGRSILQGNGLPAQDTYTIAAAGHEWIDLHWLFQVVAAYLHDHGGIPALTIAAAAMAVLSVGIGILACSTRAIAPFVAIPWIPALLVMSSRFLIRPEMISLALLAGYLWVLRRAESRPTSLWLLVPVQLLWVNVQGLFCFGPFLLAVWLIDRWFHAVLEQRRDFRRDTALPAIFVVASCFANPYGWRGAVYPLTLARTMFIDGSFYRDHIGELASPLSILQATAYRDVYVWAAAVLFLMAACSFLASQVRIRVFRVVVFAVFSGLGLTALRNLPQFAMVAAYVLTLNLADRTAQSRPSRRLTFTVEIVSLSTVIFLAGSVVTGAFYAWNGNSRTFGLKEYPLWHAHDAAIFAAREGMPDQIVAFHEGQAALVEFHMRDGQRVYADARLEVMQRPAMERYYALAQAIASRDENWQSLVPAPTTFVIDHTSYFPLEATLLADPDWTCAWFGPVAAVYVLKAAPGAPRDVSGNLAHRLFESAAPNPSETPVDPQGLRSGLNSDLLEAAALLNIARAAGDRETESGTDRRVLLLLAMRLAHGAKGRLPHPACRIGAGAAFQMYGAPTTAPQDWQLLEIIGSARSLYLLERCEEIRPGDFASLAEEYAVVSSLGDADAIYILARQLSDSRAQTAQHLRLQSLVKQSLDAAKFRAATGPGGLVDPTAEADEQIGEFFEARRFIRIRSRFAKEMSAGDSALAASNASRHRVAVACLVCGDPGSARSIWQRLSESEEESEPEEKSHSHVGLGMTYFAEHLHSKALEHFQLAVDEDPSNAEAHCALALCHLELGSAVKAFDACNFALAIPEISEGMQQFCERMRDFAERYRGDQK
jgi:hypothetical protein